MSKDEEWLRRQLNDIEKMHQCQHHVVDLTNDSLLMVGGRWDLAIALLIMTSGYALHTLLRDNPQLLENRTLNDEDLAATIGQLTLADLEALFSQMGVAMWKQLGRPNP